MRARVLLSVLVAAAGVSACNPCAGTAGCTSEPFVAAGGQIVSQVTNATVDGAEVSMVRTGGVATLQDSVATVTKLGGHWHLAMDAVEHGDVIVAVSVAAPGREPYRVDGIRLATFTRRGESHLQRRWVPDLYFPQIFELFYRGTNTRVANVSVEFRRTGGAQLSGAVPADGVFRVRSDASGWIRLFPEAMTVSPGEPLIGDLTLVLPSGRVTTRVALTPSHIYQQLHIFRLDVNAPAS